MVRPRLLTGRIGVSTVAELLAGVGSSSLAATVAELARVVPSGAVGLTATNRDAVAPEARWPTARVTTPSARLGVTELLDEAEMKSAPVGRTSVRVTPE